MFQYKCINNFVRETKEDPGDFDKKDFNRPIKHIAYM